MNPTLRVLLAGLAGFAVGMSCSVPFKDDLVYSCTSTNDCGGDGFVCTANPGGAGACCKPTADAEVCGNGIDDDCDGLLDTEDEFPTETCNGVDDDCDQQTDEGFDLRTDPNNCGTCGTVCDTATQACLNGACGPRAETDCADGVDNDGNGKTDCLDLGCNLLPCGSGCLCQGLRQTERSCTDGVDNDGDNTVDCADNDCTNVTCGVGCICEGGVKRETDCADMADNDGDGMSDCDDAQCGGQICAGGTTRRCAGPTCLCNDGGVVPETAALCADGVDNDCDNLLDCQEAGCDGQACVADGGVAPDGGASCLCTGGRKAEQHCADRRDNDGDGFTDCADDADCPAGTACTVLSGTTVRAGNCGASRLCEIELCYDALDNDSDTQVDCLDADCNNQSCAADAGIAPDGGPSCRCVGTTKVEANCRDRADNDGDAQADCADMDCDNVACSTGTAPIGGPACLCTAGSAVERNCLDNQDNDGDTQTDCADTNCDGQVCATGTAADGGVKCRCSGGQRRELDCRDRADNDGDGQQDCADVMDCPQGTACTRTNGQPGACTAGGTCN